MKKIFSFCTILLASSMMTSATAQEAKKEAPKSPRVTATCEYAEIAYGQPSKRGRIIFGELVPYGKVWRTGANMSTDLTVKSDVYVGDKLLKPGTYALFTIPRENEWTVILNAKPAQRGASEYEANKDKNVLEISAPAERVNAVQEELKMSFEEGQLLIRWDEMQVSVPFKKA